VPSGRPRKFGRDWNSLQHRQNLHVLIIRALDEGSSFRYSVLSDEFWSEDKCAVHHDGTFLVFCYCHRGNSSSVTQELTCWELGKVLSPYISPKYRFIEERLTCCASFMFRRLLFRTIERSRFISVFVIGYELCTTDWLTDWLTDQLASWLAGWLAS
jgi:hypothetical protein